MKKFSLVFGLAFLFGQISLAQIVTPELINFTQLANFEKAHPELYKRCATCHEKENDAGWKDLYKDLPLPEGAIIKKQQQDNIKADEAARPAIPAIPLSPSPAPTRSF